MNTVQYLLAAQPTRDGDGVRIARLGGAQLQQLIDPFLMLDEIKSDDAADYLGGFPEHPHRGFETITYMKQGGMRHRDHMGNEGVIEAGDLQWLTAGAGVLHSEIPEQQSGRLHGFQLWLNLPAAEKMRPPAYREIKSAAIEERPLGAGGVLRALVGQIQLVECVGGGEPITLGEHSGLTTRPVIADLQLAANTSVTVALPDSVQQGHWLVYHYLGSSADAVAGHLAVYSGSDRLRIVAGEQGLSALVLAGQPLREPIVQYGPFVMNTRQQLEQAMADYRDGRFVASVAEVIEVN